MSSSVVELPNVTGTCPEFLSAAVRRAVRSGGSWQETADRVAAALRGRLPGPGPALSRGSSRATRRLPDAPGARRARRVVLGRGDGLAARPADVDPRPPRLVRDRGPAGHRVRGGLPRTAPGDHLEVVARNASPAGTVSGFAPPGDIHRVTQRRRPAVAVSLHVYGTDITRVAPASAASTTSGRYRLPRPAHPPKSCHRRAGSSHDAHELA